VACGAARSSASSSERPLLAEGGRYFSSSVDVTEACFLSTGEAPVPPIGESARLKAAAAAALMRLGDGAASATASNPVGISSSSAM